MPSERKKFVLKRLKTKKGLLPRSNAIVLRFWGKCTRLERMLKLKELNVTLSKSMHRLDQLFTLQSQEMDWALTRKQTNMKYSLRLFLHTQDSKNFTTFYKPIKLVFLIPKSMLTKSSLTSKNHFLEKRSPICKLFRKLKHLLTLLRTKKMIKLTKTRSILWVI